MTNFRAPKGTYDILPVEVEGGDSRERRRHVAHWRRLEDVVRACCERYGYEEVRPPCFEHTELFHKSSGETTDIVEKEMFTFGDPNEEGASFSLRPEITPGVVRAVVERSLLEKKGFWKLWYFGPAFRREEPQAGRFRQFSQIGVEAIGSADPLVDVESMLLFGDILRAAGVPSWDLRINSMLCGGCRGNYRDALRKAVGPDLSKYCENCRKRFERNVFRILDCKQEACVALSSGLPGGLDHGCDGCRTHMKAVEVALGGASVPYRIDNRIVRGLDYYTRTVYEFSSSSLGAQDALCGGGRYDTLVKDMGGPDVGAVGFAAGAERILMAAKGEATSLTLDFYGVAIRLEQRDALFQAVARLRGEGLRGDMGFEARSVKAQFRMANRTGARYALVMGPEEAAAGRVKLKDMSEGGLERDVTLEEAAVAMKEDLKR